MEYINTCDIVVIS